MIELLITIGTMALCSLIFLWARALWSVSQKEGDPTPFFWDVFFSENRNRLILQGIGCVIFGAAWEVDPVGVSAIVEQLGLGAYLASVGAIGGAVGFASLWLRKR